MKYEIAISGRPSIVVEADNPRQAQLKAGEQLILAFDPAEPWERIDMSVPRLID